MKKILAFEADRALAEQLAHQFAAYGCTLDVVDDGNLGLQKARQNRPDLILLSIELPKMNGFSICNKLKKNPELKNIPLVILSSEATEDTFQQHRKLRTHADEYLRKPFDFQELIRKIGALMDLGAPGDPAGGFEPSSDGDIAIDDSGLDVMVDEDMSDEPFGGGEDDVEAFAETAFAALQVNDGGAESEPGTFEDFDNDEHTIAGESPFSLDDGELRPVPLDMTSAAGSTPPPLPFQALDDDIEAVDDDIEEILEPEEEAAAPPLDEPEPEPVPVPVPVPVPAAPASAGPSPDEERLQQENEELLQAKAAAEREADKLRSQAQRLEEAKATLESEVKSSRAELDEARSASGRASEEAQSLRRDKELLERQVAQLKEQVAKGAEGGGAVSSREFLDLRELLNKKDRELLDLKDSLNAKEKALLDQREKITAHERQLADRDDRILAHERQIEDLNDRLAATTDDKAMLARKVEGLDKRVETTSAEIERVRRELESEQDAHQASKKAGDERRHKELAELKQKLESEAEKALEAATATLREELEGKREGEVAGLKIEHDKAAAAAEERRERELTEQRLRHEETLRTTEERLRADKDAAVSELEEARQKAAEESARSHSDELRRIAEEHAEALAKLKAEHEAAFEEQKRVQQRDMGVLGIKLAETEGKLKGVQDELAAARATVTDLEARLADREGRIAALEGERDGLRSDLEAARDTIGARDAELVALRGRVDQVERWNGHNEERAIRALRKLQEDREVLDRARRAMAIALTLLADLPEHDDAGPPPGSKDGTLRT